MPGTLPPIAASSPSFANTTSGRRSSSRPSRRSGPVLGDPRRRGEVDADPPALRLHGSGRLRGGLLDRPAQQRVAGEVQPVAAAEPAHVELLRPQERARRRDPRASSGSPSAETSETTTPLRPSSTGPSTSTPRLASSRAVSSAAPSVPRLPTNRASAPSSAAQAATFADCPPAPTRVSTRALRVGARGARRSARSRRGAGRRGCRRARLQSSHGRRPAPRGSVALLRLRRADRRLGRDRHRETPPREERAAPRRRAGRLRGRAVPPGDAGARSGYSRSSRAIARSTVTRLMSASPM